MMISNNIPNIRKSALLVLATIVGLWLAASWVSGKVYDRDCRDFGTHGKAQLFYHLTGGPMFNFHGLDGDRDGSACESLP